MAVDLNINLVVKNLKNVTKNIEKTIGNVVDFEGGGKSGGKKKGGDSGGGKGLFFLGGIFGFIAGLVSSMDAVMGILKVIGGMLNALVAPFVPILLTILKPVMLLLSFALGFMIAYFKNPMKVLIKLGLFIVNGILTGIELLTNTIRGIFRLDPIEMPKFQFALVDKAFDDMSEAMERAGADGEVTFKEALEASKNLAIGIGNSFLKASTLTKLIEEGLITGLSEQDTLSLILDVGAKHLGEQFDTSFSSMNELANGLNKKSKEILRKLGENSSDRFVENLDFLIPRFQGPVRPETDLDTFRDTGRSVENSDFLRPRFQGPVRPETDSDIFRDTGRSVVNNFNISGDATEETIKKIDKAQRIGFFRTGGGI